MINPKIDLIELLKIGVCDLENEKYMIGECGECPGYGNINEVVTSCIDEEETVKYKQWTSVDRADLITVEQT